MKEEIYLTHFLDIKEEIVDLQLILHEYGKAFFDRKKKRYCKHKMIKETENKIENMRNFPYYYW